MSRRVYRWRVAPPPNSDFEVVEVLGASRYEAMIAAAKIWRTPWTPIVCLCAFEKLGDWTAPSNCNDCQYINMTEEEQHKTALGSPHICLKYKKRVYHNSGRPGYHGVIYPCKKCIEEAGKT